MALNGGKHYVAPKIIDLMPPRCKNPNAPAADDGWLHYVEPFAGGLSVLLANDPEGISEVVNDKNELLTNFWNALRIEERFRRLQRDLESTPFAKGAYADAAEILADHEKESYLHRKDGCWSRDLVTWAFFVACRQSLAGRMKGFTGVTRNRTRRGMNAEVSAWLNCIEGLPEVHTRLKRVMIFNENALDVIRREDGPRTLFYLDPPYLHSTRATTGEYTHEMTEADHRALLESLAGIKGRFLLSGYESPLYDSFETACKWKCHRFDLPNNSAGGAEKRRMVECVWTNY